ncbi:hypothetical protein LINPERPRIM_LOCUS33795 [Linum perenne]
MNTRKMKVRKKVKVVKVSTMHKNVQTLQKMIPGCEQEIEIETLFLKSIHHILKLKSKVQLLKDLLKLCDS